MPLSRLAVAVLFKGQNKPHVPDRPGPCLIGQALIRQGRTGSGMPSCQCSACLLLAALAQDQGEYPVFARAQQQPAAHRCIEGRRIAPDLDNQRGKIAASGRLPGAPDRIPEALRTNEDKAACIDTVLPQTIGKRQTAVESRSRIDDPEYPAICRTCRRACLPGRARQQRQDKSRRSADVAALGAAHFVKPVPDKAA